MPLHPSILVMQSLEEYQSNPAKTGDSISIGSQLCCTMGDPDFDYIALQAGTVGIQIIVPPNKFLNVQTFGA